jgi:hypothetical protein
VLAGAAVVGIIIYGGLQVMAGTRTEASCCRF